MDVLQNIFTWVNDPMNKTILALIGGFVMKRWTDLVNKAIPVVLLAASALVAGLSAAFPGVPGATPALYHGAVAGFFYGAEYQVAGLFGGSFGTFLAQTLLPVAYSIAMQSGAKNTREWWTLGFKLFDEAANLSKRSAKK